MDTLLLLGVCVWKFYHIFCSSQSCNVPSTPGIETFHPHLGLKPDIECKKILQLCKKNIVKVQQKVIIGFD